MRVTKSMNAIQPNNGLTYLIWWFEPDYALTDFETVLQVEIECNNQYW